MKRESEINCLIIKTSALGDIIQSLGVIAELQRHFVHVNIDWVAEASFQEVLQAHIGIRKVIAIDTKLWRRNFWQHRRSIAAQIHNLREHHYAFVWDLQGNIKSALVMALSRGAMKIGFGRKSVAEWPSLLTTNRKYDLPRQQNIREDYLYLIRSSLKITEHSKHVDTKTNFNISQQLPCNNIALMKNPVLQGIKILVCFGSRWSNKQLPLEMWQQLLEKIAAHVHCSFLFLWGTDSEKAAIQTLQNAFAEQSILVPKLSIIALQNLMQHIDLVLAVDSMALHLAATAEMPTFSIFGPSLAQKYQPMGSIHTAIQGSCPYGKLFEKRCPILRSCATGACIRELSVETIFRSFIEFYETLKTVRPHFN